MSKFLKYFPLVKVDEATHTVWGIAASETPDHENEICDYETAKPQVKKWSDDQFAKTRAAGQDPSLGNMRVMHQLQVGGKATKIEYHDAEKEIWVGSEPANGEVWHLLKGGFLTMHSIGGSYAKKWADGKYQRYTPEIGEISYVDKGSNPDAVFAYVKADGSTELRKFATPGPDEQNILSKIKGSSTSRLSDEDVERLSESLAKSLTARNAKQFGEAFKARFQKGMYTVAQVAEMLDRLNWIQESLEFESEQEGDDSPLPDDLNTIVEDLVSFFRELVAEETQELLAGGVEKMNKEQIEKCAKALGITVEEFTKTYVEGEALEKGKKGLAALHAHLKKAVAHHGVMKAHHEKIGEMHKAHAAHHATMGDHLENCMKAHGALQDAG